MFFDRRRTQVGKEKEILERQVAQWRAEIIRLEEKIAAANEGADNLSYAMRLLEKVYGGLWTEAYYDPGCDETQKFAKPLADLMIEANRILGFKK
jgi:hypothetical protein